MNSEIRKTLEAVKSGELSVDDALLAIKKEPLRILVTRRWICIVGSVRERLRSLRSRKDTGADEGIIGAMLEHEVKTICSPAV